MSAHHAFSEMKSEIYSTAGSLNHVCILASSPSLCPLIRVHYLTQTNMAELIAGNSGKQSPVLTRGLGSWLVAPVNSLTDGIILAPSIHPPAIRHCSLHLLLHSLLSSFPSSADCLSLWIGGNAKAVAALPTQKYPYPILCFTRHPLPPPHTLTPLLPSSFSRVLLCLRGGSLTFFLPFHSSLRAHV